MEQLCALQEQLLQRCMPFVERASQTSGYALELLDDLRAHVDPDAPSPVDVRGLVRCNEILQDQLQRAHAHIDRLLRKAES